MPGACRMGESDASWLGRWEVLDASRNGRVYVFTRLSPRRVGGLPLGCDYAWIDDGFGGRVVRFGMSSCHCHDHDPRLSLPVRVPLAFPMHNGYRNELMVRRNLIDRYAYQ